MIPQLVSAALLLWSSLEVHGAPTPDTPAGLTIPLRMRSPTNTRNLTELGRIAKSQRDAVIAKYSGPSNQKRSTGYNLYVFFSPSPLFPGLLGIWASMLTMCLV